MQLQRLIRLVLTTLALVSELCACSSTWQPGMPISNGNHAPYVALQGDDLRKYKADLVVCQKKVLSKYGDRYASNNAIIALRECLIAKGYVLLS